MINHEHGIDAYVSIVQPSCTLDEAIEHASDLVTGCAEDVTRLVVMGRSMALVGSPRAARRPALG